MQLREAYGQFQGEDTQVVALAVAPLERVDGARTTVAAPYPMLADPDHQVAEAYGVYDLLGDGYAAPAVFVIDTDGRILWSTTGQAPTDRPTTEEILAHLP